eukprot:scaffold35042_cov70-Phaeocystis_antarctica.AAC.3
MTSQARAVGGTFGWSVSASTMYRSPSLFSMVSLSEIYQSSLPGVFVDSQRYIHSCESWWTKYGAFRYSSVDRVYTPLASGLPAPLTTICTLSTRGSRCA